MHPTLAFSPSNFGRITEKEEVRKEPRFDDLDGIVEKDYEPDDVDYDEVEDAQGPDVAVISSDADLDAFKLKYVSAALDQENVVEGGFFSSLILAPFKALFWGVTFLLKVVGVIALVIGVAVMAPVMVVAFGAFLWYLTNKVRKSFRSAQAARAADPEKYEQARKVAPKVVSALDDPRVQNELKSNPAAAKAIYDTLASMGYQQQVTGAACRLIQLQVLDSVGSNGEVVTAEWQKILDNPMYDGLMLVLSTLLGGWVGLVMHIGWFMAGLRMRKWRNAKEAAKHDKIRTAGAVKAAKIIRKKMNDPRLQRELRKSPEAAKLLHETLQELDAQ